MKVVLVALLLMPSILPAQGTINVASVYGPVDHKTHTTTAFVPLSSSAAHVNVGDTVRTGPGATLTLEFAGGPFVVVSENSMLTIQAPGPSSLLNLINAVMGKVQFYIQRLGGKSNPRGAGTVTALLAVRS